MVYIILFCSHWNTFAAAAEEYGGERSRKACEGEVGDKWEKIEEKLGGRIWEKSSQACDAICVIWNELQCLHIAHAAWPYIV